MSVCRSCGAPITWAETKSGRRMPIDADPVEDGGTIMFAADGTTTVPYVIVRPAGEGTHRPHWVTCFNADQHRRRR
jgi:hypothetical protein